MKNKFLSRVKSIIALMMCLIMVSGFVACSTGGGDPKNVTVIRILTGDNAFGLDLLRDQGKRFAELHKDDSYAEGKTGVLFKIEHDGAAITLDEGMLNEGYHVISTGSGYITAGGAASNGWIASVDDIVTEVNPYDGKTIASKIPAFTKKAYRLDSSQDPENTPNGYYGLPSQEAFGGLTYDKDLFDRDGYYFADPAKYDATNVDDFSFYKSEILGDNVTYKFTSDLESRSVGPDGLPETEDDGLPSSLYELIVLCEKLDNDSIKPFIMSGKMNFYINYFTEALYTSLLGYEDAKALLDFKSDEVDIVVGYSDEDLFPGPNGLENVKKPITQKVKIKENCGYYMSQTVEKYYTIAFMQLMEQQNWYASAANSPNKGAADAELDFVFGLHQPARQGAMLIECSYWVNESRIRENFKDYDIMYGKTHPNREFRWMSLPVNISTTVDGTNTTVNTGINNESKKGEYATLNISTGGFYCINARYANNKEIMDVLTDWFRFIYSDQELSWLMAHGNYSYLVNYQLDDSLIPAQSEELNKAPSYTRSFMNLLKTANKVYPIGDSKVYDNNKAKLGKQGGSASYLFGGGDLGTTDIRSYLLSKANKANPVLVCFEEKMLDINKWQGYFGSNAEVPEAQKYPAGHPKEGQDIKYEGENYSI